MSKRKIGLFGGTFDPIHNGHLYIAAYIKERCSLDEIVFMPTFRPPHKSEDMTSSYEDRFNMVSIAIEDENDFQLSSLERDLNNNVTYSIDIVDRILKDNDDIELYFILGSDSLFDIEKWKNFEKLLEKATMICFSREVYKLKLKEYSEYLISSYDARIILLDNILIDISSTHIRGEIQNSNKSVRFLLPENVVEYIKQYKLYSK
ncbi:MAG: nicotinate-nucleotide adenylyltransferase [Filifactoraceae bacterium]